MSSHVPAAMPVVRSARYAVQTELTLVSAAHDQDTPAVSPVRRRRASVITGYRAVLDPAAVGLGFEALVSVTLERGDAATVAAFEAALAAIPQIRHAERLFGDPD
jgi:hypothetical protein